MIPLIVNPDAEHRPSYLCCDIVRSVVASARLDGCEVDVDWLTVLHDVVMRERTVDDVVNAELRRHAGLELGP